MYMSRAFFGGCIQHRIKKNETKKKKKKKAQAKLLWRPRGASRRISPQCTQCDIRRRDDAWPKKMWGRRRSRKKKKWISERKLKSYIFFFPPFLLLFILYIFFFSYWGWKKYKDNADRKSLDLVRHLVTDLTTGFRFHLFVLSFTIFFSLTFPLTSLLFISLSLFLTSF